MGHKLDFIERVRFKFARVIGGLLTGIREKRTSEDEFVGYVEMGEEGFEETLHEMNFHRNPLSYWKYIPGIGHEQGSWRKNHGVWQHHVILYTKNEHPDRTYVYAHWEYRWDRYPLKHLRGVDASRTKGVNRMRSELNKENIEWYDE